MKTKTALLVIDLQRAAFDGVRCPPVDQPERLVRNACALIDAARQGDARLVFVQHCEGAGEPFEEGSVHGQLHESIRPHTDDHVLRKTASSSFEGTDLDAQLKADGVGSLVLCGLQSEFCISNTARSALQLGYRVRVAADAHSTWPSGDSSAAELREAANDNLRKQGAEIVDTASLVSELAAAPAQRS